MSFNPVKATVDAVAVGVTIGTVASWLPHIAALFTIIWTGIRIWETQTVQRWFSGEEAP